MNNTEKILETLRDNKLSLMRKYSISQLAIFGSYSRGDFTHESDIDIFVTFNEKIGVKFIDLADELSLLLGKKVDLVSSRAIRDKYFKIIEPELIYV